MLQAHTDALAAMGTFIFPAAFQLISTIQAIKNSTPTGAFDAIQQLLLHHHQRHMQHHDQQEGQERHKHHGQAGHGPL
jgi:hypothetical protein